MVKWKILFRWIVLLPGAFGGASLAWLAVTAVINLILLAAGTNPSSFIGKAFITSLSGFALGSGFVFAGAAITPNHRRQITFVLAVAGFMTLGRVMWQSIAETDYFSAWSGFCAALGVGSTLYAVSKGKVGLPWSSQ